MNSLRPLLTLLFLIIFCSLSYSQIVTEIITDFNGFWRSSTAAPNAVKPNNSHQLLAFSVNGVRYATGINNAVLTAQGLPFITLPITALPVSSISGSMNANSKIALGASYDGVPNGASVPPPANTPLAYLSDGIRGLNLGTGIANIPVGTLNIVYPNILPSAINDGVPDLLFTQIADPSGSSDSYQFVDAAGNLVGNAVTISFTAANRLGDWTVDFYEASQNPMSLQLGFTRTDRAICMRAADYADFGITPANANTVSRLQVNLSGNSDMAFIAGAGFSFTSLPSKLHSFMAARNGGNVRLSWSLTADDKLDYCQIEQSTNGFSFQPQGRVAAPTQSGITQQEFNVASNIGEPFYFRMRLVNRDGSFFISNILKVMPQLAAASLSVSPNPMAGSANISGLNRAGGTLYLYNLAGAQICKWPLNPGNTSVTINTDQFSTGNFIFIQEWAGGRQTCQAQKR